MMDISLIPTTDTPPADARPSELVRQLRRAATPRRIVLKGMLVAAMAGALSAVDWAFSKAKALAGPTSQWTTCKPTDYTPSTTNWWSGPSACFGGWRRGPWPCASGFHFEGSRYSGDEGIHSTRIDTACSNRNAWQWVTSGVRYRCSDANTEVVWNSGERYRALTIAQCRV